MRKDGEKKKNREKKGNGSDVLFFFWKKRDVLLEERDRKRERERIDETNPRKIVTVSMIKAGIVCPMITVKHVVQALPLCSVPLRADVFWPRHGVLDRDVANGAILPFTHAMAGCTCVVHASDGLVAVEACAEAAWEGERKEKARGQSTWHFFQINLSL